MGVYRRCRNCGNEEEKATLYQCGNGHVYCEECSGGSRFFGHPKCPQCDEGAIILGFVEQEEDVDDDDSASKYSTSDQEARNHAKFDSYLEKHFDQDVAKAYAVRRKLFEGVTELIDDITPESREKLAAYIYTKAFIDGWNAKK